MNKAGSTVLVLYTFRSIVILSLLGLLLLILTSCKKKETVSSKFPIDVDINYKNDLDKSSSLTSHFFKHRKVVPLETTDQSLIAHIERIIVFDNRYYIFDHRSKSIFVFDSEGRFINKVRRLGKGPGEYIQITDFTISPDRKQRILLCDIPNKLIFLDLDGNFIKQTQKNEYDRYISSDSSAIYFSTINSSKRKHIKIKNQDELSYYLDYEDYYPDKVFFAPHPNIIQSKHTYYHPPFDNIIFQLEKDSVFPKYRINLGKKSIDVDFIRHNSADAIGMSTADDNLVYRISDFRESDKDLTFCLFPYPRIVVYNKSTKECNLVSKFHDSETGLYLDDHDLMGYDGKGNEMMFIISASLFKLHVLHKKDTTKVYERYKEIATGLKEDDNPVLILYTLK